MLVADRIEQIEVFPKSAYDTFPLTLLLTPKRDREPLIPNLDHYLEKFPDSSSLAFEAAKNGDIFVLEILLDPVPSSHYEQEKQLRLQLQVYEEQRAILTRRKETQELQKKIGSSFYRAHGPDISGKIEELEMELSMSIDNYMYQCVLENRKYLAENKHIYQEGGVLQLDLQKRVALHKRANKQLEIEFKALDIKVAKLTIYQLFSLYEDLEKSILKTKDQLKQLSVKFAPILEDLENHKKTTSQYKERHFAAKLALTSKLEDISQLQPSVHIPKIDALTQLPVVSIDRVDAETGNTLLHTSLSNGQYNAALYLIFKFSSLKATNKDGIAAIDMQDKEGNTLCHYLARIKNFDWVCDLICAGAKLNILNKENMSAIDMMKDGQNLLHFLLAKLKAPNCNPKYQNSFLVIAKQALMIPHLLLRNETGQTIFELIVELPKPFKIKIFDGLRSGYLEQHFPSKFQSDINFSLLKHFLLLVEQQSYSTAQKWLSRINQEYTIKQLKFLKELQKTLSAAKNSHSDRALIEFLVINLKSAAPPSEVQSLYLTYIKLSEEDQLSRDMKKGQADKRNLYTTFHPTESRDYFYNSTYELITRDLGPSKPEKLDKDKKVVLKNGEQNSFETVLTTTHQIKNSKRSIDPSRWFDDETSKKKLNK